MSRVKNSVQTRQRRKKILKRAKGFRGARSRTFKVAKQAVMKAGQYSYRDRRRKKRVFRSLWIIRINAAVREHGLTYSRFINLLKDKDVIINRKTLAYMAVHNPEGFAEVINSVK